MATGLGFEGQLSNPLVTFAGLVVLLVVSTYAVWLLEHDSNTRLRTLNDSFWEMNTFATGNFSTDTLKTSGARLIGAMATILGRCRTACRCVVQAHASTRPISSRSMSAPSAA